MTLNTHIDLMHNTQYTGNENVIKMSFYFSIYMNSSFLHSDVLINVCEHKVSNKTCCTCYIAYLETFDRCTCYIAYLETFDLLYVLHCVP